MPFLRYKRTQRQPFGWRFPPRQSKKYNKNNSNEEKKKTAQYNVPWVNSRLNEKTQTKGKLGKKKKIHITVYLQEVSVFLDNVSNSLMFLPIKKKSGKLMKSQLPLILKLNYDFLLFFHYHVAILSSSSWRNLESSR